MLPMPAAMRWSMTTIADLAHRVARLHRAAHRLVDVRRIGEQIGTQPADARVRLERVRCGSAPRGTSARTRTRCRPSPCPRSDCTARARARGACASCPSCRGARAASSRDRGRRASACRALRSSRRPRPRARVPRRCPGRGAGRPASRSAPRRARARSGGCYRLRAFANPRRPRGHRSREPHVAVVLREAGLAQARRELASGWRTRCRPSRGRACRAVARARSCAARAARGRGPPPLTSANVRSRRPFRSRIEHRHVRPRARRPRRSRGAPACPPSSASSGHGSSQPYGFAGSVAASATTSGSLHRLRRARAAADRRRPDTRTARRRVLRRSSRAGACPPPPSSAARW